MKHLREYITSIDEKLKIGLNTVSVKHVVKDKNELKSIIKERLDEMKKANDTTLYLNDLDVSNITDFEELFYESNATEILLSKWDVSNAKTMRGMFSWSKQLHKLDLSKWNMSNVETIRDMFYFCRSLTTIGDISTWDMSNCTDMTDAFNLCKGLSEFDANDWKLHKDFTVNKVKWCRGMFDNCRSTIIPAWYKKW